MSSRIELAPTNDPPTTRSEPESSEFLLLDDQKIPEEDRKEILESIEKVAAENRISAGEALFAIKPLKRGFFFPLMINLAAAIAVAAGFVGSNIYFSRKQADISSQAGTFFSAEGKLIEQVRKESDAKLKAKDQEITAVKAKLDQLDKESASLRNNMQSTIQAKEQELQKQMQDQLAAEKARLQKLGISQIEINSRLQSYEKQKNSEFAAQLDQYKQQSEAALKAKEQQIQAQQEQTRKALTQANKERQQLLDQAQQQEAQLRAQYEAQTQQLQSANKQLQAKTSAAEQKLRALSLQSQNEQLVSDQIVGSYNTILQDIQQAKYDQANQDIASLQNLLNSPTVDSVPTLAKRRPVDLKLLQSLKELIAARTKPGQPAVDPAMVEKSNQVAAAEKLVGEAEAAQKKGDASAATTLYTKAIGQIPVVQTAYAALMSVFDKQRANQISQRNERIAALGKESTSKSAQIDQLTKSLDDTRAALKTAQSNAADLKGQLDQANAALADLKQKLATSDERVAVLQKQLTAEKAAAGGSQQQLAAQSTSAENYKRQLAAANEANDSLKKQLEDNQAKIGKLESNLSEAETKIKSLQNNVTGVMDTFAAVQNDYANYKDQLTGLIASGTPQDVQKARELLLQFIDRSGVNSVLPGFSTVTEQVSNAAAKVAETAGVRTGRDGALNDVMKVTDYYSTSAGSAAASADRAAIDAKAAKDPLFRQTASDIQNLAVQSGKTAGHQTLSVQYQLIGTISYISSNTVTVEKLVNVPVNQGATVLIRHKNGSGSEVSIAQGKVTGLSSDSVEVTVESLLQGNISPQLLDVVYLQPHSGA